MANTFLETLQRRNGLLNSKAIWEEIRSHLSKFLDTDAAPAKLGITTQAEGLVVPQDHICKIIQLIDQEYLDRIRVELSNIDQAEVKDGQGIANQADEEQEADEEGSAKN